MAPGGRGVLRSPRVNREDITGLHSPHPRFTPRRQGSRGQMAIRRQINIAAGTLTRPAQPNGHVPCSGACKTVSRPRRHKSAHRFALSVGQEGRTPEVATEAPVA